MIEEIFVKSFSLYTVIQSSILLNCFTSACICKIHFTVTYFYELLQGALRTNPDLTANIRGFDDSIRKCKYYEEFVHRKDLIPFQGKILYIQTVDLKIKKSRGTNQSVAGIIIVTTKLFFCWKLLFNESIVSPSVVCHVIAATYQTIPSDLLKELLGDIPGTNISNLIKIWVIFQKNIDCSEFIRVQFHKRF